MIRFLLLPSSFVLLFGLSALAQQPYDPGDWTSYRDFRNARAVDAGSQEVFVATSGGVLEYRLTRRQWREPMVIGYGMSEAIPLGDPLLLLFDESTGFLWLATRNEILLYDVNAERWKRIARDLWLPGNRVVNIGVGGSSVYVETVPEKLFPEFFFPGTPLPNDRWWAYATRYKGSRNFGAFMLDIDPEDPSGVRWRGLRSKVPLAPEDLYGQIGAPPAGFPSLSLPHGFAWYPDGTLMDPYLRAMPVTDWIVDQYGYFWGTFWGGGIMRADLRSAAAEFFEFGPAGNGARTIHVRRDEIWTGGFNSGDRTGITRASRNLMNWQFSERREDARIRSTNVFDIAEFGGNVWCATDEGLLAYQEKTGRWKAFTVSENLFSDQLRALLAADSDLWIGTTRGLCVLSGTDPEIWRIEHSGIELSGVNDLAICEDTLYVATPHGLFKGSIHDREFHYAPMPGGFLDAAIAEISTLDSNVWLVTAEGVLRCNANTGATNSWRADAWLGGGEPSCVLAAPKFTWVGTRANGFWRLNRETGEWIQYTTADGLLDNRVQVIRRDGDDLLIGTPSGLTRFYWNRPGRAR
ncbi:MAG: hypothetical protein PHI18_01695 [bacterium]|nr:hypothetical protein [bacterium]